LPDERQMTRKAFPPDALPRHADVRIGEVAGTHAKPGRQKGICIASRPAGCIEHACASIKIFRYEAKRYLELEPTGTWADIARDHL
jgi:hypothetical protein